MDTVIDTNVVMSGIAWGGAPGMIIRAWSDELIKVIVTKEIVAEYQRIASVLSKKYKTDFEEAVDILLSRAHYCMPVKLLNQISCDPDDDKFIACALSTKSKIIVSGDSDLLSITENSNFLVLKPKVYCEKYL